MGSPDKEPVLRKAFQRHEISNYIINTSQDWNCTRTLDCPHKKQGPVYSMFSSVSRRHKRAILGFCQWLLLRLLGNTIYGERNILPNWRTWSHPLCHYCIFTTKVLKCQSSVVPLTEGQQCWLWITSSLSVGLIKLFDNRVANYMRRYDAHVMHRGSLKLRFRTATPQPFTADKS